MSTTCSDTKTNRHSLGFLLPDSRLLTLDPSSPALWINSQRLPRLVSFTGDASMVVTNDLGPASGTLHLVGQLAGLGELVLHTSILMVRAEPYRLGAELVRGQANKLRNLRVEWERDGWRASPELDEASRVIASKFCHCLHGGVQAADDALALSTLVEIIHHGEALVQDYAHWAVPQRSPALLPTIGFRLGETSAVAQAASLREDLDFVSVPVPWKMLETESGEYDWSPLDEVVDHCHSRGIPIQMGPILEFQKDKLPKSLEEWFNDPQTLVTLLIDLVETLVGRYEDRVSRWIVTHRTNSSDLIPVTDEQREWVTGRLLLAGQRIQPTGRFAIGVDQPWGWYAGRPGRHIWPVEFIDSVLRSGVRPAGILVDFHSGSHPLEPSRTTLDIVKVLGRYRRLEIPLWLQFAGPIGPTILPECLTRAVSTKPFIEQVAWDVPLLSSRAGSSSSSPEKPIDETDF